MEPDLRLLRLPEEAAEKLPALPREAAEDRLGGEERPELVLGVDRRPGGEVTLKLQIGEEGPHHQEPDVVPGGEVVEGELKLAIPRGGV